MPRRPPDRDRRPIRPHSRRPRVEALDVRLLLAAPAALDPPAVAPHARVVGGVLEVEGTPGADLLRVLPTDRAGVFRVLANGEELGAFGPVSWIDVSAGAGNDSILIGHRITHPARINAGAGDDRLRGGSGPNALLGGPGCDTLVLRPDRDTFDGGPGRTRLARLRNLGVVQVGASASGAGLRRLARSHRLAGLRFAGPSVVGAADLRDAGTVELLKSSYAGGHTVAVARATEADANALARLLGDPRPVNLPEGVGRADLVAFRRAAPGGPPAFEVSVMLPVARKAPAPAAATGLRMGDRRYLGRVFSPVLRIPGRSFLGDTSDDLTKLAAAYISTLNYSDPSSGQSQLFTTVYSARSFTQQADYYYVSQEVQTTSFSGYMGQVATGGHIRDTGNPPRFGVKGFPLAVQPSPMENPQTISYTTSVSENFGATVGWNEDSGFNATIGGGVSLEDSQTFTVPPLQILYIPRLNTGATNWIFESNAGALDQLTVNNSWIWRVDFNLYLDGQTILPFDAYADVGGANAPADYSACDEASAPLPFGDVFQLQNPVVTSVSAATVSPGTKFTITGTAFYPSLVESVLLDGQVLDPSSYTVVSDTQIEVVAPNAPGNALPVVVKTTQGLSNANVAINIAGSTGTVSVQAQPVSAVAGQSFSGVTVATVTDSNPNAGASGFAATINWGDESSTPGMVTSTGVGTFAVSGSHSYASAGTYTFSVAVTDPSGTKGSASGTATVTPPSTAGGVQNFVAQPISAVAGRAFTNVVAATFTDTDFGVVPSDFTAAIDWGDGILTPVTTVVASSGGFTVLGTHTYSTAGRYTFRIQVTDNQGRKSLASGIANVASSRVRQNSLA